MRSACYVAPVLGEVTLYVTRRARRYATRQQSGREGSYMATSVIGASMRFEWPLKPNSVKRLRGEATERQASAAVPTTFARSCREEGVQWNSYLEADLR